MPAEVKRAAEGVYLLFMSQTVTDDEISGVSARYQRDADASALAQYVVVIDPIQVQNPLKAARLLARHADPAAYHYVVVGNPLGAVLAERLAQQLPDAMVAVLPNQPEALQHAKTIAGVRPEDDTPACGYL